MADLVADRLADRLADFALGCDPAPGAQAMLRLSLLDWAAVGIAGAGEPVARALRRVEGGGTGPGPGLCSVIGQPGGTGPRAAALINGATSHALDYDDTHFAHIGHPSVAVIPAALALAEARGAPAAAMIAAATLGVEASIRVGLWLGRGHYQIGFHQTATAGAFGAAVAAARLIGLTPAQTGHALGLVATRAAGLKSQFGTMGKPLNAGLAASAGVECALWAEAGMQSDPAAVDGPQGFGPTHHGAGETGALADLGEVWLFETVSHKFHACCHGLHAMLEALGELPAPDAPVQAVIVRTNPRWLSVCDKPAPQTGLEAKFSYRLTAAMRLLGFDTARLGSFDAAVCADPALIALRDRVQVIGDDTLPETAAHVTVETARGAQVAQHDLAQPLPFDTRQTRLIAKAASLLGDAGPLVACTLDRPDLPALGALLRGA